MNSLPQLFLEQKSMLTPLDCQLTQNQSHKDKENAEVQKLCHNAKERQRRKRLNILYFQLCSLLPNTNRKTKLSNPAIVSQILSYIPELLSEIKKLSKQRDKMLASLEILQDSRPMVTVSAEMGSNEVVITVHSCRREILLSKLLRLVEEEELDVKSASMFAGGEKVWHTLHLQVRQNDKLNIVLMEKKKKSITVVKFVVSDDESKEQFGHCTSAQQDCDDDGVTSKIALTRVYRQQLSSYMLLVD
ncbi:transcription factor ORG3-like [Cryptomeria japonica]|uniref:transcription factor ORG3-like n=1 Tax=Cryptomeria japonica TaxID=3369 RepID=UPI0025ACBA3A|nr:transcription factor ORG3-like [Cryptomeria japonica]